MSHWNCSIPLTNCIHHNASPEIHDIVRDYTNYVTSNTPFLPISHGANSFVVARKECGRGNGLERLDALEKRAQMIIEHSCCHLFGSHRCGVLPVPDQL